MIIGIKKWIKDKMERAIDNDEKYRQRLEEEGGLNIDIVEDCKNWITEKMYLLFNLIMVKIKPG